MSRGQRVGSNPHLPPPPHTRSTLTDSSLSHFLQTQAEKHSWDGGRTRGGGGGGGGRVYRMLFCVSNPVFIPFPKTQPQRRCTSSPPPLLHLHHLHARLPSAKPRPHTPRPPFCPNKYNSSPPPPTFLVAAQLHTEPLIVADLLSARGD